MLKLCSYSDEHVVRVGEREIAEILRVWCIQRELRTLWNCEKIPKILGDDGIYRSFDAANLGRPGSNLGSLLEFVRNSSSNYSEIHFKLLWNEKSVKD